ncbi:TRAP transporter small permease [Salinisphaera sp. USBA-960]|uniref:TRAP transporter small permease subunit n=1 Tax=Salinisphaera orenii TaxID=856731 RepID=UPI000DBEA30F|nr:TRAP transporter small permease [Salifodinibacter halophilus]NNC25410.1 TRAP transporter small permease [Salifodinibacter halophilus]
MEQERKGLARGWIIIDITMVAAMATMTALVFGNVVLRYGFASGIALSAEAARILFVWAALFGAIICIEQREHLELGLIDYMISPMSRVWLRRFVHLVILVASAMLAWGSYQQTIANWTNYYPISGLPVGLLYLAGTISGTFIALIALYRIMFPREEPGFAFEGDQ